MKKQLVKIISLFSVFVLLCCPVLHQFATALSSNREEISAKIDSAVLSAFDDGAETVKVYVWLSDIDQEQVDRTVEQKTGLRADNLAVIDENISTELATRIVSEADNDKLTDETEKLLQAYLDRTAAQRTQERERTDLYTATRRAEAKTKYNQKSATFLTKNAISNEKVIFNSNYAPMLILDLTKQEVKALAARADVESVTVFEKGEISDSGSFDAVFDRIDVERIKTVSGLSGSGVKIGMVEAFCFNDQADSNNSYFGGRIETLDGNTSGLFGHAFYVARLAAGNDGIANGAQVFTVGLAADDEVESNSSNATYSISDYYGKIEQLIAIGVNVINMSCGHKFSSMPYYTEFAQWIDHIVATHNVTMVNSAGNDYSGTNCYVDKEALAENVITVGSYHNNIDNGTVIRKMPNYSGYNSGIGVSKPDVVSVGNWYFTNDGGTSFSAPIVTGTIALMLELRPSLSITPCIVKAICLASCHAKAQKADNDTVQEELSDGITEKQGAGVFNPYVAVSIVSHGTYGVGVCDNGGFTNTINICQPKNSNIGINISIAWLRDSSIDQDDDPSHSEGTTNDSVRRDLKLRLYQGSNLLGQAENTFTSTEMVYVTLQSDQSDKYEIIVNSESIGSGDVPFAYAWSVKSIRFQHSQPFEGVGYLKNLASNDYLQANTETMQVYQNSSFNGENSQMWIIQKKANTQLYVLQSAYGTIGNLTTGTNNSAVVSESNSKSISILQNVDGSLSFVYEDGISMYALGIMNSSTNSGAYAAWTAFSGSVSDSQKWYFEPCAFSRGDINLSGHISSDEARLILRYSSGLESFTTLQKFLADVDGSGTVNSNDARLTERYAAGYDY